MGIVSVVATLGDDNIEYQNLCNSSTGANAKKNGDVEYKFLSDKPIFDVLMGKSITGLVLWVDSEKLKDALAKEKEPKPLTVTVTIHDKFIYQYADEVFVVFDGTDDGSSIMGARRTLEEARALLARAGGQ